MKLTYPLPTTVTVRNAFVNLLDKPLSLERRDPVHVSPDPLRTIAVYETDDNTVAAILICDINFAVRCACALTMLPPALMNENLQKGALEDTVLENFVEIMNVATTLFYMASTPHVTYKRIIMSDEELPREIKVLLKHPAERLDLNADITGYGTGQITVMVNRRYK